MFVQHCLLVDAPTKDGFEIDVLHQDLVCLLFGKNVTWIGSGAKVAQGADRWKHTG
jgi:hypothetical protein